MDDLIRGDLGYGRKPSKKGLAAIAEYRPVDIHHYDDTTGQTTIQTIHDPNPILKANRIERLNSDGYTPSRDMKKVASIPMGKVVEMFNKGINIFNNNDWPKVVQFLDDPANEDCRTSTGKIGKKPLRTYPTEAWLKR